MNGREREKHHTSSVEELYLLKRKYVLEKDSSEEGIFIVLVRCFRR